MKQLTKEERTCEELLSEVLGKACQYEEKMEKKVAELQAELEQANDIAMGYKAQLNKVGEILNEFLEEARKSYEQELSGSDKRYAKIEIVDLFIKKGLRSVLSTPETSLRGRQHLTKSTSTTVPIEYDDMKVAEVRVKQANTPTKNKGELK